MKTKPLSGVLVGDCIRWVVDNSGRYGVVSAVYVTADCHELVQVAVDVVGEYGAESLSRVSIAELEKLGARIENHESPRLTAFEWETIADFVASRIALMDAWDRTDETIAVQKSLRELLSRIGLHGEIAAGFGVDPSEGLRRRESLEILNDFHPHGESVVDEEIERQAKVRAAIAASRQTR